MINTGKIILLLIIFVVEFIFVFSLFIFLSVFSKAKMQFSM